MMSSSSSGIPGVPKTSRITLAGLGTPVLVMVMLGLMILPLPPIALDLLFTFNIALALLVLLASVYSLRPLEFAVFPTILLIATLLRLALNVASTRVVLLRGHEGTDAAGQVIQAFGDFVIGGNYAVGFVVFAILIIINFVVVTKGAGRISEVTARFTLDAMPGKQMAIDADLNAGLVSQDDAKRRREEISQEADFYGSMDGASKFVRGDAIAGILILLINIVGGFVIGIVSHDLTMEQAAENYILLTIGDGLVAQIPSILLSAAAAIMVTRVSDSQDVGSQVVSQLTSHPKALTVTGAILGCLGIIPGMPNLVFLTLAGGLLVSGYLLRKEEVEPEIEVEDDKGASAEETFELNWSDVAPVDMVGLQVGYRLISLVDQNQGGELLGRIKGVRKKLSQDYGFLVQPVHIKDNLDLDPNGYRITMLDVSVGEGKVYPEKHLAISSGQVLGRLDGVATKDPSFGLDAVWIENNQRDDAQAWGYTAVDASTVIATHLSQLLKGHLHELLGHDEVQHMMDGLSESSPKLVESLIPDTLPLGVIVKVMQDLLVEGIPVRDIRSIAEALAEHAPKSQDPDVLGSQVRISLGRKIYQHINGMEPEMSVITLDKNLEQLLHQVLLQEVSSGVDGIEPTLFERLIKQLAESVQRFDAEGKPPVLLVGVGLRRLMSRLIRPSINTLNIMAFEELPSDKRISILATVTG
ncbi:MAG: flagellar biosynthesis protein FlhA [Candidatus Azotimanducaceae bacterium]|jgi:flagellar biosynthesis protein FlhA